jgi:hypothetical protein
MNCLFDGHSHENGPKPELVGLYLQTPSFLQGFGKHGFEIAKFGRDETGTHLPQ